MLDDAVFGALEVVAEGVDVRPGDPDVRPEAIARRSFGIVEKTTAGFMEQAVDHDSGAGLGEEWRGWLPVRKGAEMTLDDPLRKNASIRTRLTTVRELPDQAKCNLRAAMVRQRDFGVDFQCLVSI